jgi:hypothetical protein
MATKLKPNETIGDHLPALLWQRKRIIANCRYQDDMKIEWVQWATEDVNRTSLKSITQAQAKKIIMAQEGSSYINKQAVQPACKFDKNNPKHRLVLSLMRQAQWVTPNEKHGEVPDMNRLTTFLMSERSPVKKLLQEMNPQEIEKLITALNGIIKHRYKS